MIAAYDVQLQRDLFNAGPQDLAPQLVSSHDVADGVERLVALSGHLHSNVP